MDSFRADTLSNVYTGLGEDRDRSSGYCHSAVLPFDQWFCDRLYAESYIIERAVELLPREAVREWFVLKLGGTLDPDLLGLMQKYERKLKLRKVFQEALALERLYGGSAIVLGINDGNEAIKPVNTNRIASISSLKVLDRWRIYPDLTSGVAEEPEIYLIGDPTLVDAQGKPLAREIHKSRLLIFPGIGHWNLRRENNGWGLSALHLIYGAYTRFFGSLGNVSSALHDFSVFVMSIEGLTQFLQSRGQTAEAELKSLIQLNDRARSVHRLVLADATKNKLSELSRNFAGVDRVLEFLERDMTAAVGIPHTYLRGDSPSGENATGESDRFLFARSAHELQEARVREPLEYFYELCFNAADGPTQGNIPEEWSIEPVPLFQEPMEEVLRERKAQAEIDQIYLNMGALTLEEIREARFGGAEYNFETTLLGELPEQEAELEPQPLLEGTQGVETMNTDAQGVGSAVSWKYGKGTARGTIISIHPKKKTLTIKGAKITRNGSKDNPAVVVKQEDNSRALKLMSELRTDAQALQIEGSVPEQYLYDQMAEVIAQDIEDAISEWKTTSPEKWQELLNANPDT